MRIGHALSLRHEDVLLWERRMEIEPRPGSARPRRKGAACGSLRCESIQLRWDHLHYEYGDLGSECS